MTKSAYWPMFCEENVWHLAGNLASDVEQAHVAVISNPARKVAIWAQSASNEAHEPIIWDYHVILLEWVRDGWRVVDPDSTLETPIAARRYLTASFLAFDDEFSHLRPMFRVVTADEYRAVLRSDRSHMRGPTGEWLAPPPPGPPIGPALDPALDPVLDLPTASGANPVEGGGTNLMRFVDMEQPFIGWVCDLDGLYAWIGTD